jgi:hypothetical protein
MEGEDAGLSSPFLDPYLICWQKGVGYEKQRMVETTGSFDALWLEH